MGPTSVSGGVVELLTGVTKTKKITYAQYYFNVPNFRVS